MPAPYVEFTEANFCLNKITRKIKTGDSILFLIDPTDFPNIKTYIYLQSILGTVLNPTIPIGWVTQLIEYKHDVELEFKTDGNTAYVIDDQETVYLKIN